MTLLKIEINYDLLYAIAEANTGLSLNKTANKVFTCASISSIIGTSCNMIAAAPLEKSLQGIVLYFVWYSILLGSTDLLLARMNKSSAMKHLKLLSYTLKKINVDTNYELLLKAYKYETDYKFSRDESSIPKLEQKKYIMIPVYENGDEKEISIVQEHIIGTKKYIISYGSPKKVLKPAFNIV